LTVDKIETALTVTGVCITKMITVNFDHGKMLVM